MKKITHSEDRQEKHFAGRFINTLIIMSFLKGPLQKTSGKRTLLISVQNLPTLSYRRIEKSKAYNKLRLKCNNNQAGKSVHGRFLLLRKTKFMFGDWLLSRREPGF